MLNQLPGMIARIIDTITFGALRVNRLGRPEFPEIAEAALRRAESGDWEAVTETPPPKNPNLVPFPNEPETPDIRGPGDFPPWSPT